MSQYERIYPLLHEKPPAAPTWTFPWMTLLLVSSTIYVFVQQVYGLPGHREDEIAAMYDFSPAKLNGPAWWTVFSYAWIHLTQMPGVPGIYYLHIASNMVVLICVGPACEKIMGPISYLALYLGGAAASALCWMLFSSESTGVVDPQLMGASGAVFAVIAALATAGRGVKVTILIGFVLPVRMRSDLLAMIALVFEVLALPSHSSIAHTGHLGGAAFGFLWALAFHSFSGPPTSV